MATNKQTAADRVPRLHQVLASDGLLAQEIEGYEVRQEQMDMAQTIEAIIEQEQTLFAEAGTGTGKTFAYLVPALLSGKKVMISTATKTLQSQILAKDLPLLMELCQVEGDARLLKGRDNYLCLDRLEIAENTGQQSRQSWKKLALIRKWAQTTESGDKSDLAELDENDAIWQKVGAKPEFCQANGCQGDGDCFYPRVKQAANEAQVLVVNHHLFSADLALRERGFGELLPKADIYIFDEAHQLPDIAAQFLGFSVSRYQLEELIRDIQIAQKMEASEAQNLLDQANLLSESLIQFNETLGKWEKRYNWQAFQALKAGEKTLDRVRLQLEQLSQQLEPMVERGKLLSAAHKRTKEFTSLLVTWLTEPCETRVRWIDSSQGKFKLQLTPLSVGEPFSNQRQTLGGAWIFTSATLSVNKRFDYFTQRLGLMDARTAQWDSPFDYPNQAGVYYPVGLPEPRSPDYIKICLRAVWPLLKQSAGRAFLLFTSHKALQQAKVLLDEHWEGTVLAQGAGSKATLLADFRQKPQPILLGTSSFWEGIDVKGEALKLVMIDRIPFIPPDDPLVEAREGFLKEKGLSGFVHFQLPEATIALKQGAGRLIRDSKDTGVLVLCDPRLIQKGYGRTICQSLPNFKPVYQAQDALALIEAYTEA